MAMGDETGPARARKAARPAAAGDKAIPEARRGAGPVATPGEEDGQEPGRPPGKAATRALGAAAAGLGAVAAAELLDPRPGTGHAHPGTGTGHAHSGNAHPGPGHTPGPGHAADLVVAPAAADLGYSPPGAGQPGTADGSAVNGNAANGSAQPGQPGMALRTSAQTAPMPAHLQPGLALPGTSPPGAAAPPPAAPSAASGANPVSTPAVPSGSPTGSSVPAASPGSSASGGVPAAAQQLPSSSMAATGMPAATTTPLPSAAAASASQPGAAATTPQNAGPWSVLYDAAGNPAGIANEAGAFSAFPGTDAASASAASPLPLYDSAGQQAGTYSGASQLLPPATAAQSPWLAGSPPAYGAQAAQPATSAAPATQAASSGAPATPTGTSAAPASSGQQQAVTQVQYPSVQPSDAQINQEMLKDTPAEREQMIRQSLKNALNDPSTTPDQKTYIQQALDGNIADLPDSFYAHGDYTYTDQNGKATTLNTLEAATTVAMLKAQYSQFRVNIQDLSNTAGDLYGMGDDISIPAMTLGLAFAAVGRMWDTIFADLGNSSDPHIQAAQANFTQLRNMLFGGMITNTQTGRSHNTKGNIPTTAQAIRDKADSLYKAAAVYAYLEETNLSQFGVPADDPRPAWEKARFTVTEVKGKPVPVDNSTTGKYPPGYFDPNNPGSPFYDGLGPH